VVTGVSGSGKSTLVHDVLYKALAAQRVGGSVKNSATGWKGDSNVREVVIVDQSPIGRTPRSNPATYLKAFDAIREVFAERPIERAANAAGHFSFNFGRPLRTCQGDGLVTVKCSFSRTSNSFAGMRGTRFKSGVLKSAITARISTRFCS